MHFEEMSTQNKLFYNTNVQSVSLYQRLRSLLQTYYIKIRFENDWTFRHTFKFLEYIYIQKYQLHQVHVTDEFHNANSTLTHLDLISIILR